jgi:CheY-like chemotaxis protein
MPQPTVLPRGTESILFVDDESSIANIQKQILEHLGYRVEISTSGKEALAAFSAAPDRFDLVITDMTMPGIPGDVLAREIKKLRADIPVVLCTGFSRQIDESEELPPHVDRVLMKPIRKETLANTLREALARRENRPRSR